MSYFKIVFVSKYITKNEKNDIFKIVTMATFYWTFKNIQKLIVPEDDYSFWFYNKTINKVLKPIFLLFLLIFFIKSFAQKKTINKKLISLIILLMLKNINNSSLPNKRDLLFKEVFFKNNIQVYCVLIVLDYDWLNIP